ncbi:hypothetical protein [Dyella sp.]|jgi:hypothetical protein|uniref:hypothetical protein n=1 Tax=Dyella sp. TaxID=1869338 RepID=UPI002FDB7A31
MDYVKDIRSDEIIVQCESPSLRKALELPGTVIDEVAVVPFRDWSELAALLTWLQSLEVPFLDAGPGWTPAAVFQLMREEGLVSGLISGIFWSGPGIPKLRKI